MRRTQVRKLWDGLFKENSRIADVFPLGMSAVMIILWLLLKDSLFAYFFWDDEIHSGSILYFVYVVTGVVNIWIVPDWCGNKSLMRMLAAGAAPAAAVMCLRWFFAGFITAKILVICAAVYTAVMLFQVIAAIVRKNTVKRKKARIAGIGLNNILSVLTVISLAGMAGYCLTGMDSVDISGIARETVVDRGRAWDSNRELLKLWQEESYNELTDKEKQSLFQDLISLECMYWGIEPVNLEVETYESETRIGYYVNEYYVISIRKEMFDMPREKAMNALLHETHHAYVHKAVESVDWDDKKVEENRELRFYKDLYMYKEGIENYILPEEDYDGYYNNSIEVAAREYAEEWTWRYLQYIDAI